MDPVYERPLVRCNYCGHQVAAGTECRHLEEWDACPNAGVSEAYTTATPKVDQSPEEAIIPDDINTPGHYANWPIEPITFIMRNDLPFAEGNVVKYTIRHSKKNGLEDLRKAAKYLDFIARNTYGEGL